MSDDEFSQRDIAFHRETATSYDAEVTDTYGVYHRFVLDPYLDELARDNPDGEAVDLGTGTGVVALALARRGFRVLALDHSPEMLAIAERKAAEAGLAGRCTFLVADVRRVPVGDGSVDCVTCQGLLHHLNELDPALRELARILRPGGSFYISEPTTDETPLKRAGRAVWHSVLRRRPLSVDLPESVEAPIEVAALRDALTATGLQFELRFLTHVSSLRAALPNRVYLTLIRLASWPWRRRCGDLVFVFGSKPSAGETGG